MAARSATSTTKSDATIKTFVTFRIAGDNLDPDEVTRVLRAFPTHAHRKGDPYKTKTSTIVPNTGVWLLSTDKISLSDIFPEHLRLVLQILGLWPAAPSNEEETLQAVGRYLELSQFLKDKRLTATMTCFWHGAPQAVEPKVPSQLLDLFKRIPISLDIDFDRDEATRRRVAV
jgi:Domain of unknown function (DUF4279)